MRALPKLVRAGGGDTLRPAELGGRGERRQSGRLGGGRDLAMPDELLAPRLLADPPPERQVARARCRLGELGELDVLGERMGG